MTTPIVHPEDKADAQVARSPWRWLPAIVRFLMGLIFFVFGLNGFLNFIPQPKTPMPEGAMAFVGAMMKTGYFFHLVAGTQVVVGALLLLNRFVPLALALIAPVVVNIVAFHIFLAPSGIGIAIVVLLFEIYLAWAYRAAFRPMLAMREVLDRLVKPHTKTRPQVTSSENQNSVAPSGDVSEVVEHLFRHEAGKMVATLTRIFGLEHLTLAEDVVQEALARALQTWPFYGVPQNPAAWIMRASRNLALDVVRREKVFRDKQPAIISAVERESLAPDALVFRDEEIADDRLRMMFVCCHPLIPPEAHVALALKTLCGFSVPEIARAFLTTEAAIAKRLTRAKQKIREAQIPFEIPAGAELERRLDGVLQSLYLLFNEGYKASSGDKLVREEICEEAIRLGSLLAEHPSGNQPKTHALLALMLLNAARIPARTDDEGNLLRLKEQERLLWDQSMIARGLFHLAQSAAGDEITEYHLQAGIAGVHCAAKDYPSTDWRQILELYDRLVEFDDSPVVALNRAVAHAEVHGPQAGIDAVYAIRNLESLESYYLLYAVLGEFESRLNHSQAAAAHFRKALQLAEIKSEQLFLSKRVQACETQSHTPSAPKLAVKR